MTSHTDAPVPLPANHRVSESYVDWVRTQEPGTEPTTRAVLDQADRKRGRAWEKPGRFSLCLVGVAMDQPGS
ncbi:hypothetical protein AB0I66_00920 [Streptomyces sp. NPDC050439]|uniref:hypothetical protein n=1 Tax=unclassified Streptomyces TaxID=2593676 RepID=UPI00344408BE